ncbi:MFS transporter [Pseudoalteromonas sp. DL2-H2.2]|uniref:MFS transporter n=1 Tax=Pseudoalteromonas sp. DL2-H2.2 TaxID=2908889 RepID=UPI001F1D35C5|nr:MFS transporter [Pseudoalteromonas sp. DL2-H2.2]MCF2909346.1 MFS transporter [Pseudoalteromonas sp. DL2-H2.2]
MNKQIKQWAFIASCIALTVTAMTFAIRAGMLSQLNQVLQLTDSQLGWVNAMAFFGFPVATIVGGALYKVLGARRLLIIAFVGHILGLLCTIFASGFYSLMFATFLIGLANGAVEAGCNPLVTQLFPTKQTTMLNRFHVWFPGGIVLGSLLSISMTSFGLGWQYQFACLLVPTLLYGALLIRLPDDLVEEQAPEDPQHGVLKALFSPLFLFMLLCMTLTASTELLTQQWIERILRESGASAMFTLALITGVMAIGRYFAGPVIKQLNPLGVLLMSSVAAYMGIRFMSVAQGSEVYYAAIIFALGVTYFWPTMLGFVSEKLPETGALGLGVMGAAGMFAVSIWNPIIGQLVERGPEEGTQNASSTLVVLSYFPLSLVVAFGLLLLVSFYKARRQTLKEVCHDS